MQRLLQRYGKDVNRDATDTSAALGNVYGLQDLYKLSMSEAVIAFTSHEMNWLEKQLLAIHPEAVGKVCGYSIETWCALVTGKWGYGKYGDALANKISYVMGESYGRGFRTKDGEMVKGG